MLPIARKNKIKEIILEKKSVTVAELTELFNVTEETIRRDLKQLEDEGILNRTYGGAYLSETVQYDVDVNLREHIHIEGKRRIARKSLEYIKNGDSIFLDASTTSLAIASMLTNQKITVVTNSIKIVKALLDKKNIQIVVIGGLLSHSSLSNLGRNAEENMTKYFFDTAFISSSSISMENGMTDTNEQQATIRHIAATRANKVHLIVDHTKFDKTSFVKIGDLSMIDNVIVDEALSEEWREFFKENNITFDECSSNSI